MSAERKNLRDLTVDAFMSRDPLVFAADLPATEAIHALVEQDVSGAPVLDERRRVIGFLSAKDCMLAVRGALYFGLPPGFVVGDLMTAPVETIFVHTPLVEAAERFSIRPYRRLPVVDEQHQLAGVIRRHHVLQAYLEHFGTFTGPAQKANARFPH